MVRAENGQRGLCTHFGENHPADHHMIQIRLKREAPEKLVEECGHPSLAMLHLIMTPVNGCAGFVPAAQTQEARA